MDNGETTENNMGEGKDELCKVSTYELSYCDLPAHQTFKQEDDSTLCHPHAYTQCIHPETKAPTQFQFTQLQPLECNHMTQDKSVAATNHLTRILGPLPEPVNPVNHLQLIWPSI